MFYSFIILSLGFHTVYRPHFCPGCLISVWSFLLPCSAFHERWKCTWRGLFPHFGMETDRILLVTSSTGSVQPKRCIRNQGTLSPPTALSKVAPASHTGIQSARKLPSHTVGVNKSKQSKSRNGMDFHSLKPVP